VVSPTRKEFIIYLFLFDWSWVLLVCDWLHYVWQNHFYVMLLHYQGCHLFQSLHFRKVVQHAQKKILCKFQVREVGSQDSVRTGYTVLTRSLIRQDVKKNCNCLDVWATPSGSSPYYGNYVQQKCNHPDVRATPSGRWSLYWKHEARYRKPVAQLFVRTTSACVWTPPREIKISVDLDLL
jgi:hypothetical protein